MLFLWFCIFAVLTKMATFKNLSTIFYYLNVLKFASQSLLLNLLRILYLLHTTQSKTNNRPPHSVIRTGHNYVLTSAWMIISMQEHCTEGKTLFPGFWVQVCVDFTHFKRGKRLPILEQNLVLCLWSKKRMACVYKLLVRKVCCYKD